MSDTLFKEHSAKAIEACIAKALTELLGKETTVTINGLSFETVHRQHDGASFTVYAHHKIDHSTGITGSFFA